MLRDASRSTLSLGSPLPYFSLKGTDGRIYSSTDFTDRRAMLVIFMSNHCPYCLSYEPRILELAARYIDLGVQFLWICANDPVAFPTDSFDEMIEKSRALALPFPYLQDESQVTARAFDAGCTPECYLFNAQRILAYHGRIDDNHGDASRVSRADLQLALDAVLRGEPPEIPLTSAEGCSIKWRV